MDDPALKLLDRLDEYWLLNHQGPNLQAWFRDFPIPPELRSEVVEEVVLADLEHRHKHLAATQTRTHLLATQYMRFPEVSNAPQLIAKLIEEEFFLLARDNRAIVTCQSFAPVAAAVTPDSADVWERRLAESLARRQRIQVRLCKIQAEDESHCEPILKQDLGYWLEIGRATQAEVHGPRVYPGDPPRMAVAHSRVLTISRCQTRLRRVGFEQVEVLNASDKVPLVFYPGTPRLAPRQASICTAPFTLCIGDLHVRVAPAQSSKQLIFG